jgi:DNA-binding IclR family transcriptional regulator
MSAATFYDLLKEAEQAGLIRRDPADPEYWIKK